MQETKRIRRLGQREKDHLIQELASLYCKDNLYLSEIAQRLRISRTLASRILQEAVRRGVVEERRYYHPIEYAELEIKLRRKFGLQDAVVVISPSKPEFLRYDLANAAIKYLDNEVFEKKVGTKLLIGLSGGMTLSTIAHLLPEKERKTSICPLHFLERGEHPDFASTSDSVLDFARRCKTIEYFRAIPALGPNYPSLAEWRREVGLLKKLRRYQELKETWEGLDVVLMGCAPVSSSSLTVKAVEQAGLNNSWWGEQNIVAILNSAFLNAKGVFVEDLFLSIDQSVLKHLAANPLKTVCLVAGGQSYGTREPKSKIEAVRAVLNARLANVVITDHETANALLTQRS